MPRAQGFARGDLDTAFPLDDKFLALRGRLTPDRYYAATGVYFHVVASTWREAERKQAIRVAPGSEDLIAELVAVGLLTDDGRVPVRAFNAWIGRARKARKTATERQKKSRADKASGETGQIPVRSSHDVTPMSRVTPRDTVGTVGTVGTEGTVRRNGRAHEDRDEKAAYLEGLKKLDVPVDVA